MKKLLLIGVLSLFALGVWATPQDGFEHVRGEIVAIDTFTIDVDHTSYGSWDRVCSTGTLGTLDSGAVVYKLSGYAILSAGQALWYGIDTVAGNVDTSYGYSSVNAPNSGFTGKIRVPFSLTKIVASDSDATAIAPVAVFAAGNSVDAIQIRNILLEVYMVSKKQN